jgi:Tfp pilus assembly protein PilW
MRLPRMTTRWWMVTVAVVSVFLAARDEYKRMEQRRVEAEIRQLAQALSDHHLKYPGWWGCRGPLDVEPCSPAP